MPLLQRTPVMRMRWRHLLFAHWPIAAAALRPLVSSELEIDEFEGSAWIGLVPFTMEDVSPLLLPRVPISSVTDFHECNVRTYVYPRGMENDPSSRRGAGGAGVWFFSLDAASRIAVWGARTFFGLPYFNARMSLHRDGDLIDYNVERLGPFPLSPWERDGVRVSSPFDRSVNSLPPSPPPSPKGRGSVPSLKCRWRALEALPPSQPGELAHFLTERYCLYAMKGGRLHRGRIAHEPWPLRRAELLSIDDSLMRADGIDVDFTREPVLYHADRLDVRAWWLERV